MHNSTGAGCHVDPRNIAQRIMTVSASLTGLSEQSFPKSADDLLAVKCSIMEDNMQLWI